jgi:hypothetical protein
VAAANANQPTEALPQFRVEFDYRATNRTATRVRKIFVDVTAVKSF